MLRAPFTADSFAAQTESYRRCLSNTASVYGYSEWQLAILVSHFLEAVAFELSQGNEIVIDGFGVLSPTTWKSKKKGLAAFTKVFFHSSRELTRLVSSSVPGSKETNQIVERYRKRHLSDHSSRRVFTAMQAYRNQLRKFA